MSSILFVMLFVSLGIAAPPSEAAIVAMQDDPTVKYDPAFDPAWMLDTGPDGPGPFTFCAFASDLPNEGRYAIHSNIRHASDPRPTEADFRAWANQEISAGSGDGSNPSLQCLTYATYAMADEATILGPEQGGPELPTYYVMPWPPTNAEDEGHDTFDDSDDVIARAMEELD